MKKIYTPSTWTYGKREKLADLIKDKLNSCDISNRVKKRDFQLEARIALPALFKEIAAYNKSADKANNKAYEQRKEKRSKYLNIARFGAETECERIAKELM